MRQRISKMANMANQWRRAISLLASGAVIALSTTAAGTRAAGARTNPQAGLTFEAQKQIIRPNGARLEGNARIRSPQLDVAANVIAFDYSGSQITEVRATGGVAIKVNLAPQGGGAATRIEAKSSEARLDPVQRTLVLTGKVDGWYQMEQGVRNTLSGSKATLHYGDNKQLLATVEGPVVALIPAENFDKATAIGTVKVTSQRLEVNTGNGTATFAGNARAVSTDGPNKFDVAAPSFVISRGDFGTIDTLTTAGRTLVKIDLPPDPARPAPGTATITATAATTGSATGSATAGRKNMDIGRPTHAEIAADAVTVRRADSNLVFEGNVKGFYRLEPAGAPPANHEFSGDRAVIKYVLESAATANNPAGLQVEITGKPVTIEAPQFNIGL
jgi:lipopolysaccharide export system protein LptA